jgi:hypothetical protein
MGKTKRTVTLELDQDGEALYEHGVTFRLECKVLDPGPNRVLPEDVFLDTWFTIIRHDDKRWLEDQERRMTAEDMMARARTRYRIVPCLSRKARARIETYNAREDAEDAAVFARLAREQQEAEAWI